METTKVLVEKIHSIHKDASINLKEVQRQGGDVYNVVNALTAIETLGAIVEICEKQDETISVMNKQIENQSEVIEIITKEFAKKCEHDKIEEEKIYYQKEQCSNQSKIITLLSELLEAGKTKKTTAKKQAK